MVKPRSEKGSEKDSQSEMFIATARDLECDEDEDRFNATLKRIVTAETKKDEKPSKE